MWLAGANAGGSIRRRSIRTGWSSSTRPGPRPIWRRSEAGDQQRILRGGCIGFPRASGPLQARCACQGSAELRRSAAGPEPPGGSTTPVRRSMGPRAIPNDRTRPFGRRLLVDHGSGPSPDLMTVYGHRGNGLAPVPRRRTCLRQAAGGESARSIVSPTLQPDAERAVVATCASTRRPPSIMFASALFSILGT